MGFRFPGKALGVVLFTVSGLRLVGRLDAQAGTDSVDLLPLDEEVRIALSAAPENLRDSAGVYALTPEGFKQVRSSRNGFTCVVNRDAPLNRKPVCYDAEGTATILPNVLFVGEQMVKGMPLEEIDRRVAAKFASGEFRAPRRPGIAYMLTREIRVYDPRTKSFSTFPPHLMFYAPNLTNSDIGASADRDARARNPWLPFVGYQGPQGFIIVIVDLNP